MSLDQSRQEIVVNRKIPLRIAVVSYTGALPAELSGEIARLVRSPGEVCSSDDLLLLYGPGMAKAVRLFSRHLGPRTPRTLVLATRLDPDDFASALEHGTTSYLLAGKYEVCLMEALSCTARGISFLDPSLQTELVRSWRQRIVPHERAEITGAEEMWANEDTENHPELSKRECEIMSLLASGVAVQEIALRFGLSEKTVRNNLSRVYRKMNVRRQTEAVLVWLRGSRNDQDSAAADVMAGVSPGRLYRPGETGKN